ncbi:MAG TPA: hypothetical protein EYP24_03990 [bacterium (Candidatus Stahlbacteria)]|nr:hypothetical protein [Candidatus Stahlbacteria bacterium]
MKRVFDPDELRGFQFPKKTLVFWQDLGSVFSYPLQKGGKLIILMGALVFTILNFVPLVGFLLCLIFVYPYLVAFMLKILRSLALGKKGMPDWPEISEYWESILLPYIQVLIAGAICYAPAILLLLIGLGSFFGVFLYIIFILLGTAYFPMALIAVALHNSGLAPLNLHHLIRAIIRIKTDYIFALGGLGVLLVLEWLIILLFLRIPLVGTYIFWAVTIYFAAAQMYILGNIYYVNRKELAWF